jgi:hypothetical protein
MRNGQSPRASLAPDTELILNASYRSHQIVDQKKRLAVVDALGYLNMYQFDSDLGKVSRLNVKAKKLNFTTA